MTSKQYLFFFMFLVHLQCSKKEEMFSMIDLLIEFEKEQKLLKKKETDIYQFDFDFKNYAVKLLETKHISLPDLKTVHHSKIKNVHEPAKNDIHNVKFFEPKDYVPISEINIKKVPNIQGESPKQEKVNSETAKETKIPENVPQADNHKNNEKEKTENPNSVKNSNTPITNSNIDEKKLDNLNKNQPVQKNDKDDQSGKKKETIEPLLNNSTNIPKDNKKEEKSEKSLDNSKTMDVKNESEKKLEEKKTIEKEKESDNKDRIKQTYTTKEGPTDQYVTMDLPEDYFKLPQDEEFRKKHKFNERFFDIPQKEIKHGPSNEVINPQDKKNYPIKNENNTERRKENEILNSSPQDENLSNKINRLIEESEKKHGNYNTLIDNSQSKKLLSQYDFKSNVKTEHKNMTKSEVEKSFDDPELFKEDPDFSKQLVHASTSTITFNN
jgi:hypothetical protein